MSEEEKFIRYKIEECTRLIEACSFIGNKKTYAKERTQFKCVLNLIQKQQEKIKKKDKIIDLMADMMLRVHSEDKREEFIANVDIEEKKEQLKRYFEKKVERNSKRMQREYKEKNKEKIEVLYGKRKEI